MFALFDSPTASRNGLSIPGSLRLSYYSKDRRINAHLGKLSIGEWTRSARKLREALAALQHGPWSVYRVKALDVKTQDAAFCIATEYGVLLEPV
jgi:hypothetical protein